MNEIGRAVEVSRPSFPRRSSILFANRAVDVPYGTVFQADFNYYFKPLNLVKYMRIS